MSKWEPISSAPKDESVIVGWKQGWKEPMLFRWKTNDRIVYAKNQEDAEFSNMADSYFGDPVEWDDYDYAEPGGGPDWWHPLEPFPE